MSDKPLINPQDELTIAVLAYSINLLDDRLTALEKAHDAAQQFTPGWEQQSFNFGKTIGLRLSVDDSLAYLFLKHPFVLSDEYYIALDNQGLLDLMVAITEVLKRMEAGNAE